MKPEGAPPCSQNLAILQYHTPVQSGPQLHMPLITIHFIFSSHLRLVLRRDVFTFDFLVNILYAFIRSTKRVHASPIFLFNHSNDIILREDTSIN
jgi:hypothetical protein